MGAGAASAFSVLSLNPTLWLDSSVASSLFQDSALTTPAVAMNDNVDGIKDQSGNGNHATRTVAAGHLTLILGGWSNGKNIVRAPAALNAGLVTPSLNLGTSHTMFFVANRLSSASGSYVPLGDVTSGSFWPNVTNNLCYYASSGVTDTVWDYWEKPTIYAVRRTGTTVRLYKNGVPLFQNNGGATPGGAIDFTLGSNPNFILKGILAYDSGANAWPGDFAECVVFPSALSDANMANMHGYLQAKWPTLNTGKRVIFDDNSLFNGTGLSNAGYTSLVAQIMTTLNRNNYFNFSIPSITQAQLNARLATTAMALDPAGTIIVTGEVYNDLQTLTAAQAYANVVAAVASWRAYPAVKKVITRTCPKAGGTSSANFTTQRPGYNTLALANTAGADTVIDCAALANLQDFTDATNYQADQIHLVQGDATHGYGSWAALYTAGVMS